MQSDVTNSPWFDLHTNSINFVLFFCQDFVHYFLVFKLNNGITLLKNTNICTGNPEIISHSSVLTKLKFFNLRHPLISCANELIMQNRTFSRKTEQLRYHNCHNIHRWSLTFFYNDLQVDYYVVQCPNPSVQLFMKCQPKG